MEKCAHRALSLLDPLYDSALSGTGWGEFLCRLMDTIEGDAAALVTIDHAGTPLAISGEGLFSGSMLDRYPDYAHIDPWPAAYAAAGNHSGKAICSHELIEPGAFQRTGYYYDYWRVHGDLLHTCGVLLQVAPGVMANFAAPRSRGRGPYSDDAKHIFDLLAPHVRKALLLQQRLAHAEQTKALHEATLDAIGDALLVLDAAGRVLLANRAAEAELARGRYLSSDKGRLIATSLQRDAELQAAIRAAAAATEGTALAHPVSATPYSRDASVAITCFPLSMRHVEDTRAPATARVLVAVGNPDKPPRGLAHLLRLVYGLTPTEALLAEGLAGGGDLDEVAQRLRMTKGTARIHLRHVFLKTDTRRQAQLVALIHRVAPIALMKR